MKTWLGPTDLRSVGLFRITFGVATLGSIVDLAPILRAGFSDEGFWPRTIALAGDVKRFSLMDVSGPPWVTYGYWLLTVSACLCFIVGWHSRLATLATFVLWSGMVERDLALFDSSETVIRVLFFWSVFLPVGNCYSVDAAMARAGGHPLSSQGSALPLRLIQVQFAWIYLCTFLRKLGGAAWRDGTAVQIALGLEHPYTRPLGHLMRLVPWSTTAATYLTLLTEAAFLPLAFLPLAQPRAKALALVSGFALHLGIWATMWIGGFPWLMVAAYPLFFEPRWTDWVVARVASPLAGWPMRRLQPRLASARLALSSADRDRSGAAQGWPVLVPSGIVFAARVAGRGTLVALLAACMWWSAPLPQRMSIPSPLADGVRALELGQTWAMFAPDPFAIDFELRGEGKLLDGTSVDVLRGDEPPGPLPPAKHTFPSSTWAYVTEAVSFADATLLLEFGKYLCRQWNRDDRPRGRPLLATFQLSRVDRAVLPNGNRLGAPHSVVLWQHVCLPASALPTP